jgi:hypothetical protein
MMRFLIMLGRVVCVMRLLRSELFYGGGEAFYVLLRLGVIFWMRGGGGGCLGYDIICFRFGILLFGRVSERQ